MSEIRSRPRGVSIEIMKCFPETLKLLNALTHILILFLIVCFVSSHVLSRLGPCELPLPDQWLVHTQLSQSTQSSQASFYAASQSGGQSLGGLGGLSTAATLPIQQHSSSSSNQQHQQNHQQQQQQPPSLPSQLQNQITAGAVTPGAAPASQLQSQSKIMNVVVPSVACPPTASKKIRRKPDAKVRTRGEDPMNVPNMPSMCGYTINTFFFFHSFPALFSRVQQPQSQINKCNNEKRRRELENEYIEQLGEFLQIKRDMTACKPDKAAILSEVVRTVSLSRRQ